MEQYLQIFLIVFGALGGVGIFAGGIGYLRSQYRKGGKEEKSEILTSSNEIVNFWKTTAENYQTILATKETAWNEKFQDLTKQVGELRGQLTAEKNQNERLEKIFQNRDPETQEFMKYMIKASANHDESHKEIMRVLGEIHTYAKQEHDREIHVEAQITKS